MRDQYVTCRRATQAAENRSCQSNTYALAYNAASCQEARRGTLPATRSGAHQRAVVR